MVDGMQWERGGWTWQEAEDKAGSEDEWIREEIQDQKAKREEVQEVGTLKTVSRNSCCYKRQGVLSIILKRWQEHARKRESKSWKIRKESGWGLSNKTKCMSAATAYGWMKTDFWFPGHIIRSSSIRSRGVALHYILDFRFIAVFGKV